MNRLVSDLLDVARIETGTLPVSPEPAEVAALVDQARSAFISAGGRSNLTIDIEPNLPLVLADRRRMVQVLVNLLSNAARQSADTSVIRVSAVAEEVHVAVSVTDEGRGIPAESLPLLFRKFSQAQAEDQGGDTGLGLAICKGIVEAHGGRIWAESEGLGRGARFTFTLPTVGETLRRRGGPEGSGVGAPFPAGAQRRGGTGARPGGGRRPPGAALHSRYSGCGRLRAGGYRRPGGCRAPHVGREPAVGAAGLHAARHRRRGADAGHPSDGGSAGDLHLRLRSGGPHRPGHGHGGRRLRGQALLADGTGGTDPGGPAPAGDATACGALRAGRVDR